jgi:hypothetical protein
MVRKLCIIALVPLVLVSAGAGAGRDEVTVRAGASVDEFAAWLRAGDARGMLGEVGWPGDDPRWATVARHVYDRASLARLPVAAWATGEIWQRSYPLLAYHAPEQYLPVSRAGPQAAVIEARRTPAERGISVEQGAFGEWGAGYDPVAATSPLSNERPGEYGRIYSYPGAATYRFLAGRGITWVRLPFRWERLQRSPGGPLDAAELARVRASLRAAGAAGLSVVLDCHNYGAYYLQQGSVARRHPVGSAAVTRVHFADLWARIAVALRGERAVSGLALMNEPVGLPGGAAAWERASQAAVTAVRRTGNRTRIVVGSYHWGGTWQYARYHPRGPWIRDPARNTWYDAHLYFDADRSGSYARSFDAELALRHR